MPILQSSVAISILIRFAWIFSDPFGRAESRLHVLQSRFATNTSATTERLL